MGCLITRSFAGLAVTLLAFAAQAANVVEFPSLDGKVTLSAHWLTAKASGPRPAVIVLHGCDGLKNDKGELALGYRRRAAFVNAEGMHFLAVDSFGSRGQGSICSIPNARRTIDEDDRREDVFAAMKWLAAQPGVDPAKIVVAGWSHGAQTLLNVLDATDKLVQAQPIKPRAAVAFYPGCNRYVRMFNYEISAPLLIMIGELDDWTTAAACEALARRLGKPGQPSFELVVYPGSYHGFDGTGPVQVRDNIGNTRSGKATLGGNPEAREKAYARMFDFLSVQLDQPLVLSHEQRLKLPAVKP
jgi:dienelactone hydrolase